MFTNPYVIEQLAREHIEEAQREAEQNRLLHRAGFKIRPLSWLVVAAALLLAGGFISGVL